MHTSYQLGSNSLGTGCLVFCPIWNWTGVILHCQTLCTLKPLPRQFPIVFQPSWPGSVSRFSHGQWVSFPGSSELCLATTDQDRVPLGSLSGIHLVFTVSLNSKRFSMQPGWGVICNHIFTSFLCLHMVSVFHNSLSL